MQAPTVKQVRLQKKKQKKKLCSTYRRTASSSMQKVKVRIMRLFITCLLYTSWYWFDGAGMMVSNTWKTASDDKWYYLNPDGTMAKDQWVVWKDELYRVTEDGSMFEGSICLQTDEKGALK